MGKKHSEKQTFLLTAYRRVRKFIRRPWFYDKRFLVVLSVLCSLFLWSVLSVNASPEEVRTISGVHININQEGIDFSPEGMRRIASPAMIAPIISV